MSRIPSIKGAAIVGMPEVFHKALADGQTTRDALARGLPPRALALLDEPVVAAEWYDVRVIDRMLLMLRDIVGHGNDSFLMRRGSDAAERMIKAGFYQQLGYLSRLRVHSAADARQRFEALGVDLRLLTSLSAAMYNFSTWTVKPDADHGDRYVIEVTEASDFPETLCFTGIGFINRMSSEGGLAARDPLWTWSRPQRDRILYRMSRAL
jgi:hypothetical protein